jgi:hypothetical protein
MARMAMTKLENITKDRDVKKTTKIKIAVNIISYFRQLHTEARAGQCGKKKGKKIDAFELWTWRRILRVPWTEKRTNLSVLEEVKPKRSLEEAIFRLKLHYVGNVTKTKRPLERDIMLGKVAGQEAGKTMDVLA